MQIRMFALIVVLISVVRAIASGEIKNDCFDVTINSGKDHVWTGVYSKFGTDLYCRADGKYVIWKDKDSWPIVPATDCQRDKDYNVPSYLKAVFGDDHGAPKVGKVSMRWLGPVEDMPTLSKSSQCANGCITIEGHRWDPIGSLGTITTDTAEDCKKKCVDMDDCIGVSFANFGYMNCEFAKPEAILRDFSDPFIYAHGYRDDYSDFTSFKCHWKFHLSKKEEANYAFWQNPPDEGAYYGSCIQYDGNGPTAEYKKTFPQGMTMGKNAKASGTDVTLTIKGTPPEQQCAVAEISDCYFNIRHISKITFDYEISGCYDVWAAPLWFTRAYYGCGYEKDPVTGTKPYSCGEAGEIDILETGNDGHHYSLYTNFAGGDYRDQYPWFRMDSKDTETHKGTMTTELDEDGGLTIKSSEYSHVVKTSTIKLYTGKTAEANGCNDDGLAGKVNEKNEANRCMYKFVSDIFNSNIHSTQITTHGDKYKAPRKNDACTVSVKNLKMTARGNAKWDDIFKSFTPNWKETYATKGGKITQNKAPEVCKQLLSDYKNQPSVKVAAPINDILTRLDHRILTFGGVFVSVAFLFYLRAKKQAQEDTVYSALTNSTEQEI